MKKIAIVMLGVVLLLTGCAELREPVRIGSKDFTEQKLLAEMMALLAEQHGVRVRRAIPYGNSRKSLEAIQRGVIDAYPEYNGTLLALTGRPAVPEAAAIDTEVRALIAPLGLQWLKPFGLENNFALAIRRDLAISRDLVSISDLTRLPGSLRFAVNADYLVRPVDGLYALARRYGLPVGAVETFPIDDSNQLYDALARQTVDVAAVFRTDPRLNDYGVFMLQDNLGFYPIYQPAPLVRSATLASHPQLAEVWGQLAGRIDTETMRELNGQVERAGEDYRDVARNFLEQLGLLPERLTPKAPEGSVTLAVTPLSDLSYLPIRAAEAIRKVMPARRLLVERVAKPADAVRNGTARFGMVGAEEFYRFGADGELIQARDIEAVGMVGTRLAHLVGKADGVKLEQWQRIGVGSEGGSSWMVARLLLAALDLDRQIELVAINDPAARRKQLDEGAVDGAMLMVEQGNGGLLKLLEKGDYRLVGLRDFRGQTPALRYPFLRPAKIPAGTYPGQTAVLDTVSAQVVLATRLPLDPDPIGESGPAFVPGVFTRLPQRLPFDTALRISQALGSVEAVDPVLPVSPGLAPTTPPTQPRIYAQPASALLNILAIVFLVCMVVLFCREVPEKPALEAEKNTADQ